LDDDVRCGLVDVVVVVESDEDEVELVVGAAGLLCQTNKTNTQTYQDHEIDDDTPNEK
jgi:hypothetical protein